MNVTTCPSRGLLVLFSVLALALSAPLYAQTEDVVSTRPPGDGPTRVEVSFYVIDLMKVIDIDETFEADVFVLASWKDPRLAGDRVRLVPASQVWMPRVIVFNRRDVDEELPQEVTIQPDGTVVYRQRIIGTFASSLELKRFPLDSQSLEIRLVAYGLSTDEIQLVPNEAFPAARNPDLAITDWTIGELEQEPGTFVAAPGTPVLSMLTFRMNATRMVGYYVVQLLIPLLLIVAMSWAVFWVDPNIVPTRMSVSVTTVLTLIAYRFMVNGMMPRLPYLTMVDYVLLGATLLVATSLFIVTLGIYRVNRDRAEQVKRTDAIARIVLPAAFIVLLVSVALFA